MFKFSLNRFWNANSDAQGPLAICASVVVLLSFFALIAIVAIYGPGLPMLVLPVAATSPFTA